MPCRGSARKLSIIKDAHLKACERTRENSIGAAAMMMKGNNFVRMTVSLGCKEER